MDKQWQDMSAQEKRESRFQTWMSAPGVIKTSGRLGGWDAKRASPQRAQRRICFLSEGRRPQTKIPCPLGDAKRSAHFSDGIS